MSYCHTHPELPDRTCAICRAWALPPFDPDCPKCSGSGYVDYYTEHMHQSVGELCDCASYQDWTSPDADADGYLDGVPLIVAKFYGSPPRHPWRSIVVHCGSSDRFSFGRYFASPLDRVKDRRTGKRRLRWRKVSTHAAVGDKGQIEQYVPHTHRAWHAGSVQFNAEALSFETQGPHTRSDRPPGLYDGIRRLVEMWLQLYPTITEAWSHQRVRPDRRKDPGPGFDWSVLEEMGLEVFS